MKKLLERTKLTAALLDKISLCHSEERSDEESAVAGSATDLALTSAVGQTCAQLLKRPEVVIEQLAPILRELDPGVLCQSKRKRRNP